MASELLIGFDNLRSVLNQRVTDNRIELVNSAYQATITEHNKILDALYSMFVTKSDKINQKAQIRYKSPVAARLQPVDDNGRARPIKMAGFYTVAFPIKSAGVAFGDNYITRVKMTVQEANDRLALMLSADNHWMRDQILAAIFTSANYTFTDKEHGDLTILPIANGDSQVYLVRAGAEVGTTANHLRAQATLADGNQPFDTIYTDLTKRPENSGGKVVTIIPTNLKATVEGLTDFVERTDPDILAGSASSVLVGSVPEGFPGEYIGKIGRNYIIVWDALPDNYMVSICTSGDKAIAMREEPEAELQGFHAVADRNDYPWFERQYVRRAGFAAYNRVNIIVTLIGNGGTYVAPTGLVQPLS
jgi:hypothetical protein